MIKNRLPWLSWRTALAGMVMAMMLATLAGRAPHTSAFTDESIAVFKQDCVTPQPLFYFGDTVCAVASDVPLGSPPLRRFEWVAPDGTVMQLGPDITTTSQNASIQIPTEGHFAQAGAWTVKTVDNSNDGYAIAKFLVQQDAAHPAVDMWVAMFGPSQISAGAQVNFSVQVTNKGPADAADVHLVVSGATAATFVSETQRSGPTFTCTNTGGGSTCTIASLPANTSAFFTFVYQVDSDAATGTAVSNTATVTSATGELFDDDNSVTVAGAVQVFQCTISCPGDVTVQKQSGQCGATVDYPSPSVSGSDCGTPSCNPPSGSFFPIGTTNVVCVADTGEPCSFKVMVQDSQPATIICPSDVTVNETSPGFGLAVVDFPAPLLNDGCRATVSACTPPSGSSFPQGTTAVTCQTEDGSALTCSFNVTVTGTGVSCSVNCPADITQSAASGCTAVVSYASPTTSGSCGTVTCTPPSGSTFPTGTTVVTCTSSQGPQCSFTVTVIAPDPPTITACASDKTLYVTADCATVIPNLLTEVVTTGCNVVRTQSPAAGISVGAGIYPVTITAENSAGQATCTAFVTVLESFTGFFPPVNNLPTLNVVNAGRAIPVKFSLNGNKGLNIFVTGYPASGEITCDANATPVEVTETVTAGQSSLSYDPASDQYTYVWATNRAWAGTCRQLVIQLKDGCIHRASFRFR
jgi:Domain of unknown function DUF11/HYR domain